MLIFVITISTSIFFSGIPAQAVPVPSLTIVNSGTSLSGSSVNNFDPSEVLDLTLTIDVGELRISLGTSGAVAASGYSLSGSTIGITGTQAQINTALSSASVTKGCDTARNITGHVMPGNGYKYNSANGHWYVEVSGQTSGDSARDAAKAKTIPLGLGIGNGYLANITSSEENDFIKNNFGSAPQIGGSDAANEGDWYWMDGPEAGTKFYSNGVPENNSFASFGSGEPNNLGTENYLQTEGGNWNDNSQFQSYLVEFGGMPGDDFIAPQMATQTAAITVPSLAGLGTSVNPHLISNQSDFEALATCGASKYFQQTADIATDANFKGLSGFSGHFDGNSKTIDLSGSSSMNAPLFGGISGTAQATDTTVSHLKVTGATPAGYGCNSSILANTISYATIDDIEIDGASIRGNCQLGLLAINVINSVIKNTDVNGSLIYDDFLFGAGALAASANNSQFINDTCALQLSSNDFPWHDEFNSVGGCVGRSDSSSYTRVTSSGTLSSTSSDMWMMRMDQVGGLIGYCNICTVVDSSSSVGIDVGLSEGLMPAFNFGGLIGMANSTTVNRSFASGSINAPISNSTGGLIGYMYLSTISNSYSTGAVSAGSNVGSLIGSMDSSSVSNSYSTGAVVAGQADSSHGLIGSSTNNAVTNSFWKINSTGVAPWVESFGQEVPKFSGELKNPETYVGWNMSATPSSSNDWAICPSANGGYPYLAWQTVSNGCVRSFTSGSTVLVSGVAYVGGTVSASLSGWDNLATLSIQWLNGTTPIPLATSATYTPVAGDVGKQLSVRVTGAKTGYISSVITTAAGKIAAAPVTKLTVVGGFSKNSLVASKATKTATKALLKNLGTVMSVQCDAFLTAKKLTAAQKVMANARASAVCALVKAANPSAMVVLKNSVAKKTDKIVEGVRVTIISLLP